jgi:hypothetical protein
MASNQLIKNSLMRLKSLAASESGATLAEYALVTVFIGFAGFVIFRFFPAAIRSYVAVIYFAVSLPLP